MKRVQSSRYSSHQRGGGGQGDACLIGLAAACTLPAKVGVDPVPSEGGFNR